MSIDITAYSLARVVGDYLDSRRAAEVVEEALKFGPGGNRIRARTARRWLKNLDILHGRYTKGVYIDGHEREDVVRYRNEVFLPQWRQHQRRFVVFEEDGSWKPPSGLLEGEKPLVFITHDESTFNANDGKRQGWMIQGRQLLKPKGKGKRIMVSGFLTPGGRLRVPDHIPDSELLQDPQWVKVDGKPVRDAMWLLEHGKDNYWTGDKMVEHAIRIALPIFRYAFPNCQALFAFDNPSNHCSFSEDALVAKRLNLNPVGQQPIMRDGFDYKHGLPQAMVFSNTYHTRASWKTKRSGSNSTRAKTMASKWMSKRWPKVSPTVSFFTWSTRLHTRARRRLLCKYSDGFSTRFSAAERSTRGRAPGCWPVCDILSHVSLRTKLHREVLVFCQVLCTRELRVHLCRLKASAV